MDRGRLACLGFLLALLAPTPAWAAILFVDDDDPSCGGRSPCFAAVRTAVAMALSGDEVVVLPGFYLENLLVEAKQLTLRSEAGPSHTVIDGSGGGTSVIRIDRDGDATIEGFTLQRGGGNASFHEKGYGVFVGGISSASAVIRNNVLRENIGWRFEPTMRTGGGGIGISSRALDFQVDVEIVGNLIIDNFRGIDLDQMEDRLGARIAGSVRILNNVVAFNHVSNQFDPLDLAGGGIHLQTCCSVASFGALTIDVLYNTIYGNVAVGGGGLAANAADLSLRGNILFMNTAEQRDDLSLSQLSGNAAVFSNIIGDGQLDGVDGNSAVDPALVDPDGGDFRPAPGSPAIDAIPEGVHGCATGVDTDQRGVPRPQGAACDIGAIEVVVALKVEIDIKPGSEVNAVNPKSRGLVPVAILGSDRFDVRDIDPTTLAFGPDGAFPAHKKLGHLRDADHDGLRDLLSHYRTRESGIRAGDQQACVTGETVDGTPFEGCDSLRTVPRRWRGARTRAARPGPAFGSTSEAGRPERAPSAPRSEDAIHAVRTGAGR